MTPNETGAKSAPTTKRSEWSVELTTTVVFRRAQRADQPERPGREPQAAQSLTRASMAITAVGVLVTALTLGPVHTLVSLVLCAVLCAPAVRSGP